MNQATQSKLLFNQKELNRCHSRLQQTQAELERLHPHFCQGKVVKKDDTSLTLGTVYRRWQQALGFAFTTHPESVKFISQGKHLWTVFKTKGTRNALAKILKKTSQKLDNVTHPIVAIAQEIPCSDDADYQKWLNKNYPRQADLRKMAETVEVFSYTPIISIIMPVFNTPECFLKQAVESVLSQVYPFWELCIADDCSTEPYVKQVLEKYAAIDLRIKVSFRKENGHISRASNSAIEIATGEFIALLDHDDVLTPDALYEVALLLNRHPDADMIYSDEDKVDEHNKLKEPFFKPDWCPDSFLSRMYTCHLGVYRKSLVDQIERFREGYEGSQDYDLVLRLTEKTNNIFHIPKILYHWRIHCESASCVANVKPYAAIAAERALADALKRRGEPGRVIQAANLVGHYVVRYKILDYKLVSIIIPTKDLADVLDKCLTSIFEKTVYPNYEVIVIDNGSKEQETVEVLAKWQKKYPDQFRCFPLDIPFNFSKINNYAVSQAKGDYLLFLNNDIEVITSDWLNAMIEQAQRPSIGSVGALLLYPDNTVQHAGVVMGIGGVAGHSHKYYPADAPGYFNQLSTVNNYSAVTAACLMCRREVFEAVEGFEEELSVAFNDVDLCLKIFEKGYRNIYLPHVILYHYESKSRGYEDTPEKQARFCKEIEYMHNKWRKYIKCDPCYNINLTCKHEDYSLKI
ncbi:glycosyl transferase family 2 [Scytonema hofmannii PCC 7110]|uniref:Glycosyl transferase family 2 n=2 Tax=Scytonema hofmannii TaxID=34078 RepID=A0A139X336_9CYAN|nr:glycosyl transferase family 2 [Scytonema hofmannii PCC 7110]